MWKGIRIALLAALCVMQRVPAFAQSDALTISGYGDFRAIAAPS